MPTLAEHRFLRIATLCLLYLAQGIPWGFVTFTLAAWFAGQGMAASELGAALAITSLPWSFKYLAGPIVDRFSLPSFGRRRPWIILAQTMMVLTVVAILGLPDLIGQLETLVALLFVHNLFAALQDVAVDALAVDLLAEDERGTANGLMYGFKYLGGGVGGAGLSVVMEQSGLSAAIAVQGGLLAAILALPVLLRERPGDRLWPLLGAGADQGRAPSNGTDDAPHAASTDSARPAADDERTLREMGVLLIRVFTLRSPLLGALFALVSSITVGGLGVIATIFYVQHLGWADTEYAQFAGGPALLVGLAGAVAGGWLADRLGRKRVIGAASAALGVTWLLLVACEPWWGNSAMVKGFLLFEALFQSMMSGALFALCMDLSLPAIAATQFTAYMALLNLSSSMGQYVGGQIQADWSYPELFLGAGIFQIAVVGLLFFIDPDQTRRVLGAADDAQPAGAPAATPA